MIVHVETSQCTKKVIEKSDISYKYGIDQCEDQTNYLQ